MKLPYFDFLLARLAEGDTSIEKSFGRHVHWGYWPAPDFVELSDDDFALAAERMTDELCQLARIQNGQRVLDVGCGFGGTVAFLNEQFDRIELFGLNIDPRQLARANQMVTARAENAVEFYEGDACQLPFADESFDRLLAVECIFHFPDRDAFFREAARVLRPGGRLVLSDFVPSLLFLPFCLIRAPSWLEEISGLGSFNLKCTVGKYQRLADRSGLTMKINRNVTRHTLPTYDYLANMITKGKGSVYGSFLALQKLLGKLGLINYRLLSFEKTAII